MEIVIAIASVLKLSQEQIKNYEEWATVYFVRFHSGSPKFVSKKAVASAIAVRNTQLWVICCSAQEKNWFQKIWVAKLSLNARAEFKYDFLPKVRKHNPDRGGKDIEFRIASPGLYKDSEGSYFEVRYTSEGLRFTRYLMPHEARTILLNTRPIPAI